MKPYVCLSLQDKEHKLKTDIETQIMKHENQQ
jgi:hypothetical protein